MRQNTLDGSDSPIRAQPFLKWAGGKSKLAPLIIRIIHEAQKDAPAGWRYFEPFLGGGAIFFALSPTLASLSDLNPELINAYVMVRNAPIALESALAEHRRHHSKAHFYQVRAEKPRTELDRAARFIYLNKTCFNGLWRVNQHGEFNVPYGDYPRPSIYDSGRLRAVARALRAVRIECKGFPQALEEGKGGPRSGDFVYLDPPYVPISRTSAFTSYTREGFGSTEQAILSKTFESLRERGVRALLSNSKTPLVDVLYPRSRYWRHVVGVPRAINSVGSGRGRVEEILIANFSPGSLHL